MRRIAATIFALVMTSCSLGQGTGDVQSDKLFAHECWGQADGGGNPLEQSYDLQPDFFAANPYRSTVQIRVQHGNDLQEVSDGLAVLIDDVPKIRAALAVARTLQSADAGVGDAGAGDAGPGDAGAGDGGAPLSCDPAGAPNAVLGPHADGTATFRVALPAGVTPPGSPSVPPPDLIDDPPIVHMALYLHRSCHNQNTVLYAVSGTITFTALFSGDPNESSAAEKLIDVTQVDVQVGDIRDVPLGAYPREIPCELQSRLHGSFKFYFDRGQPAQPFP
jgi:hypothetical protein